MHIFGSSTPFLCFSRLSKDTQQILKVYETEAVKSLNPVFKAIELKVQKLCLGNYDRKIYVDLLDYHHNGKHEVIGRAELTLNSIKQNLMKKVPFWLEKGNSSG